MTPPFRTRRLPGTVFACAVLALSAACGDLTTAPIALTPSAAAAARATPQVPTSAIVPGHYVIKFSARANSPAATKAKASAKVPKTSGTLRHVFHRTVNGFAAALSDSVVARLRRDPDIAAVIPDQYVKISDTTVDSPNWGLGRIDQRTRDDGSLHGYAVANTGAGVRVYIIDTGIRPEHQEFGGRARIGADMIGGDGRDCHGHGTHVAATVGGRTVGVAHGVELVGVRVLDCNGSGTMSDVIAGVEYVAQEKAADESHPMVVNMSLSGASYPLLDDMVDETGTLGVVFAVAAGNSGADACDYSPARSVSALTVAAIDEGDKLTSWSNRGACVDLAAPGEDIVSASTQSDSSYVAMSGTSMASPHVAGVAALYLEGHPMAWPSEVHAAVVDASTRDLLYSIPAGTPNRLLYANFYDAKDPTVPSKVDVEFTSACSYATCQLAIQDTAGKVYSTIAWETGDGRMTSGATSTVTYTVSGTYTVTLTVRMADGATARRTHDVTVYVPLKPVVTYQASCGAAGLCTFLATSRDTTTAPGAGIRSNEWMFGDGGSSVKGDSVQHRYANAGTYNITLISTTNGGVVGVSTSGLLAVIQGGAPSASFTISCDVSGTCTARPTEAQQSSRSYTWEFATGAAPVTGYIGTYRYAQTGDYVVWLTVVDATTGLTGKAGVQMHVTAGPVNQPPVASFTSSCTGLACRFTSTSTDAEGAIVSTTWQSSNGVTLTGTDVSYTYAAAGTYPVTLTVKDAAGATSTAQKTITVTAGSTPDTVAPVAQASSVCSSLTCTFDGSLSSDERGAIASFVWSFGDGTTASGSKVSHAYKKNGTYRVTLTVKDGAGNTATKSLTVTVKR